MHELGLQDLMTTTAISASPLMKDRKYFKENVLYAADNNKLKCNHNIDGITQEDMNDDNYPLLKLQLIFKVHTKNENDQIIRTDCFYAPVFYNYVVNQLLSGHALANPITNAPITRSDIDRLINILKTLIPDIPHPFMKSYDKDLLLYTVLSNDMKYYECIVVKNLGRSKIKICQVCIIPNEQEKADEIILISQVIKQLFDKQLLLHNYMPPYFINNKQFVKIPFISTYNSKEFWRTDKQRKINEFLIKLQNLL
jgi:hypothetical protein